MVGPGKRTYANGETYVGEFARGLRHGHGKYAAAPMHDHDDHEHSTPSKKDLFSPYRLSSIGKAEFLTPTAMWDWVKSHRGTKLHYGDLTECVDTSDSPLWPARTQLRAASSCARAARTACTRS